MKCKFCGNDLPEESKFCPSCGAPVEAEEKQEQSEQSAEAKQQENQNPYEYGVPGTDNESGAQNENPYQYGSAEQNNENPYQYGSEGQNNENPYQYGSAGQNTSADYNANNGTYGQPQKPINGTTYLIFAIISTLLCCLPLGIVAIVYACKINSLQRSGAQNAAKKAKMFTIIGTVAALVVSIFYIIFAIVIGIGSSDFDDDSVSNVVENVIEDKNDSKKADDSDKSDKTAKTTEPAAASSGLGTSWDSYTVQINDEVLTFPCTKADVEAAGLSMDTEYTAENYVVNANEYELVYFVDANDNEIMAYAINNTDTAMEVKDCLIGGVSVDDFDLENGGLTVIFPGGIQMGASKDAVTGAYGEADDTYDGDSRSMYSWYSDDSYYKSCEIDFDAESGLVCMMTMQNFGQ